VDRLIHEDGKRRHAAQDADYDEEAKTLGDQQRDGRQLLDEADEKCPGKIYGQRSVRKVGTEPPHRQYRGQVPHGRTDGAAQRDHEYLAHRSPRVQADSRAIVGHADQS
jgi:hypothetical protein